MNSVCGVLLLAQHPQCYGSGDASITVQFRLSKDRIWLEVSSRLVTA